VWATSPEDKLLDSLAMQSLSDSIEMLMRFPFYFALVILFAFVARPCLLHAQTAHSTLRSQIDSDGDGLSDALEQSLLIQFAPEFMIDRADCSGVPAEFRPRLSQPKVEAENDTIYGQVFPAKPTSVSHPMVEIHYYDLWERDCGAHGHPLDAEHVSVLVQASTSDVASAKWTALYWFAAAHQNTVCDVSQIARASTLKAQTHGATVWVSAGKHASFLNQKLCHSGCGNDVCEDMKPMAIGKIINLGEIGDPMNGSIWISSPQWPLSIKMAKADFPPAPIARLNDLPPTEIAWFHPGRHPAQGIIAISSSTADALGNSGENTVGAMSVAGGSTDNALQRSYHNTTDALGKSGGNTVDAMSTANGSTDNALQKSYHNTVHALGSSAKHVGNFLHPNRKPE
jgi:hypothetical protein